MIFQQMSTACSASVEQIEGAGKKAHNVEVFRLILPSQPFWYDSDDRQVLSRPLVFRLTYKDPNPFARLAREHGVQQELLDLDGKVEVGSFESFVTDVDNLVRKSDSVVNSDYRLTAITACSASESVVITGFENVAIPATGVFGKPEVMKSRFIEVTFLGVQFGKLWWVPGMFDQIRNLEFSFVAERDAFAAKMNSLNFVS